MAKIYVFSETETALHRGLLLMNRKIYFTEQFSQAI
jgi:hypothetical protein